MTTERLKKDWLLEYERFRADSTESVGKLHFWAGVVALSAATRRQIHIDHITYQVWPNFYVVLVGPAGVIKKSTTIDLAINLYKKIPRAYVAPSTITWQAFVKDLAAQAGGDSDSLKADGRFDGISAAVCAPREWGLVVDFRNSQQIDFLNTIYDSQYYDKSTVLDGQFVIQMPFVNFISGTTPAWVQENFTRHTQEGGLASRTVFVYSESKTRSVVFVEDHVDPDYHRIEAEFHHDLAQIAQLSGKFAFDQESKNIIIKWVTDYDEAVSAGRKRPTGFGSRRQLMMEKLAMLLAIGRRDKLIILPEDAKEAIRRIEEAERDFAAVFNDAHDNLDAKLIDEIMAVMTHLGPEAWITASQLHERLYKTYKLRSIQEAVMHLVRVARIVQKQRGNGTYMYRLSTEAENGVPQN